MGLELLRRLAARNTIINLSRRAPPEGAVTASHDFTHFSTDLGDAASVRTAVARIRSTSHCGIDGLINCAAVQFTPKFTDDAFDPASIRREIAINLTSPIELMAGLLQELQKRPQSFVLNVNSGLGIVPKAESAVYCTTKAALDCFTRAMRAQLRGTNIRMQQVFLPLVDTPMTQGRGSGKLSSAYVAERIIHQIETGYPDLDIGKVKLLRAIDRFMPPLARRIMQKGDA